MIGAFVPHRTTGWRLALVRGTAALTAVLTLMVFVRPGYSAPGDIFSAPAPQIGADPPKATDIKAGDATVSTQTGALEYGYTIAVPPGRNGMVPSLRLTYSSQAPTYGGIAAGWSLPIPSVSQDPSYGTLDARNPAVEGNQPDPRADDRFVSSLAGGRPLVAVTEPIAPEPDVYMTYRAQSDTSWTRFERMDLSAPYRWRARTTNGVVHTFGETAKGPGCPFSDHWAPLTESVDQFGNAVSYEYTMQHGECVLSTITYGHGPSRPPLARVEFSASRAPLCNGVETGAQSDYRSGHKFVTGANIVQRIIAEALDPVSGKPVHTRVVTLGYDPKAQECNQVHAPVRLLTSIQESAWGDASPRVDLPPVTFEYNSPAVTLVPHPSTDHPWANGHADSMNLGWGYRWGDDRPPSIESMFLDVDGDGLQDLVQNASVGLDGNITDCRATWRRNRGVSADGTLLGFAAAEPLNFGTRPTLPRLKWAGAANPPQGSPQASRAYPELETCSLNGQITAYENVLDNGVIGVCHDGTSCVPATDPADAAHYCAAGGTECPPGYGGVSQGRFRTHLAYRWLDVDADGLVDLVAAPHGDIDHYDIEYGNRPGYDAGEPAMYGIPGAGQWPGCNEDVPDTCIDVAQCLAENNAVTCGRTGCSTDWEVVSSCSASSPHVGCLGMMAMTPEPPQPSGNVGMVRGPYMRCEGRYVWLIFKNLGNGQFAENAEIKYQPIPLESASGDSSIGGQLLSSTSHAYMDFDGDSIADAVLRDDRPGSAYNSAWHVWLGDGSGGFHRDHYTFLGRPVNLDGCTNCPFPYHGDNTLTATYFDWGQRALGLTGLTDLNGDGLPDHWLWRENNVAFHRGFRLELVPSAGELLVAGKVTTPVSLGDVRLAFTTTPQWVGPTTPIRAGMTKSSRRMVDVDSDGRVDVITWPQPHPPWPPSGPDPQPSVHFNVGGQFTTAAVAYPGDHIGAQRNTIAEDDDPDRWWVDADLIDLDGDGLPESVHFDSTYVGQPEQGAFVPTAFSRSVPQSNQPPRLLKSVSNGRGARSEITYGHMHDASVVEQNPELQWWDGRPKASPRAQWVVKSVSSTEFFPSVSTATTRYDYKNPRFGHGDHRYGFRGFEEVWTIHPGPTGLTDGSGSSTVNRYDYQVDWSGRLAETVVLPGSADGLPPETVHTVERVSWQEASLFGGTIKTYHPEVSEKFTCAPGQDETACTALPAGVPQAAGYTRTTHSLGPVSAGGGPMAIVENRTLFQTQLANQDGDRETVTTHQLDATSTTYFLHVASETRNVRTAGAMQMYGKSASTYDPAHGTRLTEEIWIDTDDSHRAISRWEYDPGTGNVLRAWKPKQNALGGEKTSYSYDSRQLFIATETNELGHQLDYEYEYGTGQRIVTAGPNQRTCTSGCVPIDATHPQKQTTRLAIDGLGRVIERWETQGDEGDVYELVQVETNSYVDTATTTVPTSISNRLMIGTSWSTVKETKTELDGHGRPIRTTLYTHGTAPADQVTTYTYRPDGKLGSVSVPDPTANNASLVTYTYGFDTLGRPTSIRRPDSNTPGAQSGVDMTYEGLAQTTEEFVGAAGGEPAKTQTVLDSYGRLVEVHEWIDNTSTAVTLYHYGPDDLMRQIVDPEGVTTLLEHDFAGRRTAIERANRRWTYAYDANGNMISETTPHDDPMLAPFYTSYTTYDDLDRPVAKLNAWRELSAADLDLFGADREAFKWDAYPNGIGRLGSWTASGISALDVVSRELRYDAQGNLRRNAQEGTPAGIALSRVLEHSYYPFGGVATTHYGDFVGGTNQVVTTQHYDPRGLPWKLTMGGQIIAEQTRNVAGLVIRRHSPVSSGPMTYADSVWTYDRLGRVTDMLVERSLAPSQVARQTLTYFGNDDVHTMDHALGADTKQFTFSYDRRHQITGSTTSAAGYFDATYTYGQAGRFATATHERSITPPLGADPQLVRDVEYQYQGADPEHVTALTDVVSGDPFATYEYDDAGNQRVRSYPETDDVWEYTYDGKNQLRRVVHYKNGVQQGLEEFWYDDANKRTHVLKRDSQSTPTEVIAFLGDVQAHHDKKGVPTKIYSHLSMGTPLARVERTSDTATRIEYQFHGLASNTLAAVAEDGTINASFRYAPFGELLEATDAGGTGQGVAAHQRRLNDKYQDDLSSLAYYGYRYYDKTQIGWTQGDPLYRYAPDAAWTQPRRGNLYAYSLNNTLRFMDPDGRDIVLVGQGGKAHDDMEISQGEAVQAVRRSDSLVDMSRKTKDSVSVGSGSDIANALSGRSDKKVAYWGHAFLGGDPPLLNPADTEDTSLGVTPEEFVSAIGGMASQPTDVYLFGCETSKSGFAQQVAEMLPGVRVHAQVGMLDMDSQKRVTLNGETETRIVRRKGRMRTHYVKPKPKGKESEKAKDEKKNAKSARGAESSRRRE